MNNSTEKHWYDNKILTNILVVIFFPVGLYGLWKSKVYAEWWKITATIIVAIVVITNLSKDKATGTVNNNESSTSSSNLTTPATPSTSDIEILQDNATYESVTQTHTIHVKVKNTSGRLINYLDLKSVFYDKKGNIVGTGIGNAANIAAGASKTIDVMAMGVENAERYEIEVGNVMKE